MFIKAKKENCAQHVSNICEFGLSIKWCRISSWKELGRVWNWEGEVFGTLEKQNITSWPHLIYQVKKKGGGIKNYIRAVYGNHDNFSILFVNFIIN